MSSQARIEGPVPLIDVNDPVHLGIVCDAEPDGHPNTREGVRLTYARYHVLPLLRERWAWLVPLLGLTPTSSIALIGCAYGYSLEVLTELGIPRVVGTETSATLQTKKSQSEDADLAAAITSVGLTTASGDGQRILTRVNDRAGLPRSAKAADVLNEDLSTAASRTRLRNALTAKGGSSWDLITENVLTVLSDAECQTLSSRAHQLANVNRVIHLVSTTVAGVGQSASYNWKTVGQWKALLPADTIVSLYTREIL